MSDVDAAPSAAPTNSAPSSGASATATPSPAAASSAPASVSTTPAAPPEGSVAPSPEQAIPYSRFKEVNDQLKAAKEWRDKFGWAEEFQGNPYPYLEQWIDQVSAHPEMGPKLLAKAARMLQSRRGQAPAVSEEPAPDVPIQDAAGNVVSQTYSATQLKKWQEWNWQQRDAALSERLSPLEQMKTALEQREQQARIDAHSQQHATTTLTTLRKSEVFAKHEPQFKQFFAEHEEYGDNVHAAWWDYYQGQVAPSLAHTEQAKVLDHLQTQANGATVHPSGSQVSGPPQFKSFKEASEYYSKHPEEAARMAERR